MIRASIAAFVPFLALSLHGQVRLKADLATTKRVVLSWTGSSDHACNVERATTMATWSSIATTNDGKAEDLKVAPYGTYRYRVNCAPGLSNELIVGPRRPDFTP
jgi:hypothetical protein